MPGHGLDRFHGGLERQPQVERVVGVPQRDVRIGRQVENGLETRIGEQPVELVAFEHIELVEMEPLALLQVGDVLFPAQMKIVDAPDFVAAGHQGVAEMTADEAGSSGN